ncbi:hypothetical protein L210DRAFT_3622052 [Boletus edulis BED1]|uniref:Uncharacterized protein n=1 Tax=Boletus edulis BED1 TaxID=1328754 RepID=A0AAD4GE57_BOLED|nr:hypothetical protein L210DRAFT_3622052 [Boletus edulis BED1]
MGTLDVEDILSDALEILGGERVKDPGYVQYGPLRLTVAPKDGKANTLLADHLFSPALVLAELVERGVLPVAGRRIIELGAGCALPSLLAATIDPPPSLIVATDYPDDGILGNLKANVDRNKPHYRSPCQVYGVGFEWGSDIAPLFTLPGYDIVIMSDLLHFDSSHEVLMLALSSLLAKSSQTRVYVAAGNYTAPHVCDNFINLGTHAGLIWEEKTSEQEETWMGSMIRACRWWIGRWSKKVLD